MNLNQITTRIGELSAELLTLHKDMAFILEGGVFRQLPVGNSTPAPVLFDWKTLKEGDEVHLQRALVGHGGINLQPGIYTVAWVEDDDYTGTLPFAVCYDKEKDSNCWIRTILTTKTDWRKV